MTVMDTYAPGTFCWADLGTPDAAAAKRFYTSLFEWSFEDRPIAILLPATAELEVVETAPIMKTATKTASTKPARLSNGVTIQVPEFISEGERVRVNPREGVYLERAK